MPERKSKMGTDTIATIAPVKIIVAVTPSDTVPLQLNAVNRPARALLIGGAGTLKIIDGSGEEVTFASGELAVGYWHAMHVVKVFSTGTTATPIKVGY